MAKIVRRKVVTLLACTAMLAMGSAVIMESPVDVSAATIFGDSGATIAKADGFYTHDGASVSSQLSDGSYGIRWKATVEKDFHQALIATYGDTATINYGTLIGPTTAEMTIENADLAGGLWTTQPDFTGVDSYSYTATMRYKGLTEEEEKQAFALELEARMYVEVKVEGQTPVYYYAEQGDVERSMRGVSIAAKMKGESVDVDHYIGGNVAILDTELSMGDTFVQVNEYYGTNSSLGVSYYSDSKLTGLSASTSYDAYIGAVKTYSFSTDDSGSAHIYPSKLPKAINGEAIVEGEAYDMALVDRQGNILKQPFRAVTKIISNATQFAETFKITEATVTDGVISGGTTSGGYYVLDRDITWGSTYDVDPDNVIGQADIHKVHNNIGLTGTFDGNGHVISGVKVYGGGLFGMICGGTVKNVAIKYADSNAILHQNDAVNGQKDGVFQYGKAGLAYELSGAKLTNVYMEATEIVRQSGRNKAFVATTICNRTEINDCIFKLDSLPMQSGDYTGQYGSLCSIELSSNDQKANDTVGGIYTKNWSNVYVISPVELAVKQSGGGYWPLVVVDAPNKVSVTKTTTDKEVLTAYLPTMYGYNADWGQWKTNKLYSIAPVFSYQSSGEHVCNGIKRYNTWDEMKTNNNNDISTVDGFTSSYWVKSADSISWWK